MICLQCDSTDFRPAYREVDQEFRGETLIIWTRGLECEMCGWFALDLDQVNELRRNTADEYRRKHKLLTSVSIKAMRVVLDMSQVEFAQFVGVGEASVKRWETWLVQERSSDELLRLKFAEATYGLATGCENTAPC